MGRGRGRGLLSPNDRKYLRNALRMSRECEMAREWADGSERIRVTTVAADPIWAPAKMLVRLECWWSGAYSSQYFPSVSALEEAMDR